VSNEKPSDSAKALSSCFRTKPTANYLLNFDHSDVLLSLVVCKRYVFFITRRVASSI
jgi:hypothetical protein